MSEPCIKSSGLLLPFNIVRPVMAATITLALFLLMAFLITPQQKVPENSATEIRVDILRDLRDESSEGKKRIDAKKPEPQETPPPPAIPRTVPRLKSNGADLIEPLPPVAADGNVFKAITDQRATPMVRIPPQYPQGPLARGIEGWVMLEFTITQAGSVSDVLVLDADPKGTFERAAIRAIQRWKYQPKLSDGKAVPQYNMREMIRFEIKK